MNKFEMNHAVPAMAKALGFSTVAVEQVKGHAPLEDWGKAAIEAVAGGRPLPPAPTGMEEGVRLAAATTLSVHGIVGLLLAMKASGAPSSSAVKFANALVAAFATIGTGPMATLSEAEVNELVDMLYFRLDGDEKGWEDPDLEWRVATATLGSCRFRRPESAAAWDKIASAWYAEKAWFATT